LAGIPADVGYCVQAMPTARRAMMRRSCRIAVAAITALPLWLGGQGALAQKSGGILKMPDFASPASMSIHEEASPKSKCPRVQSADLPIPLPTTPASGLGTLRVSLPRAAISMPRWCVSTSTGCGCSGLGGLKKTCAKGAGRRGRRSGKHRTPRIMAGRLA